MKKGYKLLTLSLRERSATLQKKLIFHSFSHYANSITIDETRNMDQLVNWHRRVPIHLPISRCPSPHLWTRSLHLGHSALFQLRTMASDLGVLILSPDASHLAVNPLVWTGGLNMTKPHHPQKATIRFWDHHSGSFLDHSSSGCDQLKVWLLSSVWYHFSRSRFPSSLLLPTWLLKCLAP